MHRIKFFNVAISTTITFLLFMAIFHTGLRSASAEGDTLSRDGYTPYAEQLQHQIDEQLSLHPGWEGLLSWDSHNAIIVYLGPADLNPYKTNHTSTQDNNTTTTTTNSSNTGQGQAIITISPSRPVNERDAILQDTSSTNPPSVFEEDADYNLIASNNPHVNFGQWLNAMNSNNNYWLQVTPFYDARGAFGTPAWRMDYDVWVMTQCNELVTGSTTYPIISQPNSLLNVNDPVHVFIRADASIAGKYTMGEFDNVNLAGTSFSFTLLNDNGHNINLGRQVISPNNNCPYDSGGQVEEDTDGSGAQYNFGTLEYDFSFFDTPTSSKTISVTNFFGAEGTGASVTTQSGQGVQTKATYTYSGGLEIFAQDQAGNAVNGLAYSVYDSTNHLIASGYTPGYAEIPSTGTYYVDYDNYGSYHLTSAGNYPDVTNYGTYSWGGQATVNIASTNGIVQVFGLYSSDTGCPCKIQVTSKDNSYNSLTGMYMQLQDSTHTQINSGYTPVTFSSLGSGTYYVYANDYCNTSTHQNLVFSRWGDGTTTRGDTVNLQYGTSITAYYSITSC